MSERSGRKRLVYIYVLYSASVLLLFVVVVVLTLARRLNAARGHRAGSNNSGAEDYLRRKTYQVQNKR